MAEHEPISGSDLAALARQARDVHLYVTPDALCLWASDAAVRTGVTLADLLADGDAPTAATLLGATAAGPVWVRLKSADDALTWMSAVSVPREDGGWTVQLREAHQLDPTAGGAPGHDPGSGVADREQVLNEVAWLLSATPRTGKEIAVASCDLDDFSFINEEYGEPAGDEVLRIVTGRISDALRSGDLVARLEDDQLLVVLRGVHHLRGAIRVANKIRAAVEDPIPMPFGDIVQTVSVGVTLISRGESVDSVLERAEGAMSMAKDAGRNLVMSSPPI